MISIEQKTKILSEIEFKRCEVEDVKGISDLITQMHPESPKWMNLRSRSPEYYNWIYFKNPVGNAIVFCAKHNGKIISTFAMAPKSFYFFGKEIVIAKTMDMFTHDDYQGLGLMSKLSKLVFDKSKEQMTQMWYVTPSVNSYPIFKNKWKYKETVKLYYCLNLLDPIPLLRAHLNKAIIKKLLWLPSVCFKNINNIINIKNPKNLIYLDSFGDDVDALWSNMKDHLKISIIRDSKYLKWRYIDNPDSYKIIGIDSSDGLLGIIVLKETIRKGLKIGEIMDLLYVKCDRSIARTLLKASLFYFKHSGCAAAQTWTIKDSGLEKDYKACGFIFPRKEVKFLFSPETAYPEFYSPHSWYLTQGDGNDI